MKVYDTEGKLLTSAAGGGSTDHLDDIGDVDVASPADGDGIYWNNANGNWEAKAFLPRAGGTLTGPLYIEYESYLSFGPRVASDSASVRGMLQFQRSRGSLASPSAVQSGDYLGDFVAQGHDGSSYQSGAVFGFFAEENWGTGPNRRGTKLVLQLWQAGTSGPIGDKFIFESAENFLPAHDNKGNCGNASHRWKLVRAVTVTSGDLGFEETSCRRCGEPFRVGDMLALTVVACPDPAGRDGASVRTVPVCRRCFLAGGGPG